MMRRLLALLLLLAGCTTAPSTLQLRAAADRLAAASFMQTHVLQTRRFALLAFLRAAPGTRVLHVYIEGDGHAWSSWDRPSDNPTPWMPVGLQLAAEDPAAAVAYLARPCQYTPLHSEAACDVSVWTDARYGPAVLAAMNEAIDRLRALSGARSVALIGYSGGGAIAALLAERRHDVSSLRSVAADLDIAAWTAQHGVSPLRGSLNPADAASRLADLPQLHFVGGKDAVVGAPVVRSFQRRMGPSACSRVVIVPGLRHGADWAAVWPRLLRRRPRCMTAVKSARNVNK